MGFFFCGWEKRLEDEPFPESPRVSLSHVVGCFRVKTINDQAHTLRLFLCVSVAFCWGPNIGVGISCSLGGAPEVRRGEAGTASAGDTITRIGLDKPQFITREQR